jgi:hypothetical protein
VVGAADAQARSTAANSAAFGCAVDSIARSSRWLRANRASDELGPRTVAAAAGNRERSSNGAPCISRMIHVSRVCRLALAAQGRDERGTRVTAERKRRD